MFIDSDFWHGHPKRFIMPETNKKYWKEKIEGNRKRDKKVNRDLRNSGWNVLRIWEYDVKHRLDHCIERIIATLT